MTEAPPRRRPLPAIICLAALTLLTALVWWRVINRDENSNAKSSTKSCPASTQTLLPRPDTISLVVLNSTARKGLAKGVSTTLHQDGFTVTQVGNDTGHKIIPGVAEIRFSSDQKGAAQLLGYFFTGSTSVPLTTSTQGTLIVSLGAKYKAVTTMANVNTALAAAHLAIAPKSVTGAPSTNTCAPTA